MNLNSRNEALLAYHRCCIEGIGLLKAFRGGSDGWEALCFAAVIR